jgi:hypothetical protein
MAWQPGQSGNPRGRPTSAASRQKLRKAIERKAPAIIKKLVVLAEAGDVQAARTLLERVLPPMKTESAPMDLPDVAAATTSTEQAALIVKAVACGEIPADVGSQLLAGIGQAARVSEEMNQLRRRLEMLEEGIIR